jgi:hypothetical protein
MDLKDDLRAHSFCCGSGIPDTYKTLDHDVYLNYFQHRLVAGLEGDEPAADWLLPHR